MNRESAGGAPLSTGVGGLDDVLRGGLPAGRMHLVQGAPGAGKTTLGLQFLLAGAAAGETVLYVTLSETAEELDEIARSHGWDLSGVAILEVAPAADSLRPDQQYTVLHPGEVELTEVMWSALEEVEKRSPTRVVFDSMAELKLIANDVARYRRQVLALKQFFAGRGSTVLLLDNLGDLDTNVQSIAHSVIELEQLAPEHGSARRRLRVVKMRGVNYRSGFHDFNIERGGLRLFPRLVASEHLDLGLHDVVSSGLPALDTLLGGGIHRGTSTLLMGPAGSGKSLLATQYVIAAAERGEASALYLFDESLNVFLTRAALLGMPLQQHIDSGLIRPRQLDPAEVSSGQFDALVREAVEDGAGIVLLDSLNGYLNSMTEERQVMLKLHELLAYLSQQGVLTIMAVAQHGLLGSTTTPLDVSYLSDTVILLRYFEAFGDLHEAISVVKKRAGTHERSIRQFRIGNGIMIGEPLRGFRGVMGGIPDYTGDPSELLPGASAT